MVLEDQRLGQLIFNRILAHRTTDRMPYFFYLEDDDFISELENDEEATRKGRKK